MALLLFSPRRPADPPPFPAVTDRNEAHYLDESDDLLRVLSEALGLPRVGWSAAQGRAAAHRLIEDTRGFLSGLTAMLVKGTVGVSGWFRGMLGRLVPTHFAAAKVGAAVRGVFDPMLLHSLRDFVNRQAGFLKRWSGQVLDGTALLTDAALARAKQYAAPAWAVASNVDRWRHMVLGQTEEQRVLGVADHCRTHGTTPGCIEQAALGWRPIGTLRPIGGCVCAFNCRCHFAFR